MARNTSEPVTSPSAPTSRAITRAGRSTDGSSDVRFVDSTSGSIGKMRAVVYTVVVFARAWRSTAPSRRTSTSTSAMATRILERPFASGSHTSS